MYISGEDENGGERKDADAPPRALSGGEKGPAGAENARAEFSGRAGWSRVRTLRAWGAATTRKIVYGVTN